MQAARGERNGGVYVDSRQEAGGQGERTGKLTRATGEKRVRRPFGQILLAHVAGGKRTDEIYTTGGEQARNQADGRRERVGGRHGRGSRSGA